MPGTGGTCYPEVIPRSDHRYLVYNYTSPLDTDPPWGTALTTGETLIYRHRLVFGKGELPDRSASVPICTPPRSMPAPEPGAKRRRRSLAPVTSAPSGAVS